MNRINFNSLSAYKAPENWLDKAAAIPETCDHKRRVALPIYRIAAAASIVLVSVIGLLTFLFFGHQAPITIREKDSGDVQSTEADGSVPIPDDGSYPSLDTVLPTVPQVVPTDAEGNPVIEPSTEPTTVKGKKNSSATEPTESIRPTQNPVKATEFAQKPTQGVSLPTEAPVLSTDPPAPPATQAPTDGFRPPGDTEFYGMFSLGDPGVVSGGQYVAENTTIFCRIYDSYGSLVGDGSLFSPQREATILSKYDDGTVVAYYNPVEKGLYITEDAYEYVFYDIHGNEFYRDIKFVF